MDSEGVRLPPKPTYQNPTALFKSSQLDLTPEKESARPTRKQLNNNENSNNLPTKILGNTTNEAKKIYAWYAIIYCHTINLHTFSSCKTIGNWKRK